MGNNESSSALLGGIEKIANIAAQGGLKLVLATSATRVTSLLSSTKNAQSELDNAKKVLESYKKSN